MRSNLKNELKAERAGGMAQVAVSVWEVQGFEFKPQYHNKLKQEMLWNLKEHKIMSIFKKYFL
jgi:hypothetical protein